MRKINWYVHFGPSLPKIVDDRDQYTGLRKRLDEILEHRNFHLAVIILITVELLISMTEMILALYYESSCPRIEVPHSVHVIEEILPWISYIIVCGFLIECFTKLWVYRLYFFHHVGNSVDLFAISISFALDTVSRVHGDLESREQDFAALLLILRFWRILRIVHGITEEMTIKFHHKYHHLKEEIKHLKLQLGEKENEKD
jgi:hypothetical protein